MQQFLFKSIVLVTLIVGCGKTKTQLANDIYQCFPEKVFLFRHAEKQKIRGENNPELTRKGFLRANALASFLSKEQPGIVFSSEYARTQQTANPIARAWDVGINIHTAKDPQGQIDKVLKLCSKNVIIVGHSNTIPGLLKLLGINNEVVIGDEQYGDLFTISWKEGKVQMSIEQIGVE